MGETVSLGFYTRREPVRAKIPGGEIILGLGLRSSLSGTRYEFQEEGQVKVTCDQPISADEFHGRYGYALRCLMTFVCDRAQTIEKFSVWRPDAADQEIIVVGELVQPEKDEKDPVSWHEMIFTFDAIDFPDFIQKWFRLTEAYEDACNVYFGLLYGPPPYLDIKFENVANAVLLYYERGQEGAARRAADALRMKAILGGLSGPDKDWLIDRLGVNPRRPLRPALDDLLDKHGDAIAPLTAGRRERFVESVLGTLEYAARRDQDLAPAAMEGADLYWLTEKLRFLLKACFMHETGISQDAIRAFFARNALFQHIHHEESARESSRPRHAEVTGSAPTHAIQQPPEAALRPTGSPELEAFWSYLEHESPRGRAVAVAAYFDEALGRLLGGREESLMSKITTAHRRGLLTNNERDDLNEIRKLRNLVVRRIGGPTFHEDEKDIVLALKTWKIVVDALPQYETMIVTPEDRLVYVASVIAARLGHRSGSGGGETLAEPDVTDVKSWPPVILARPRSTIFWKSRFRRAQHSWRRASGSRLYGPQRSLQMIPWISAPKRAVSTRALRLAWITNREAVEVAAAHSRHNLPASFQLVSSAFLTAAARTTSTASWCGASSATLTSRSRFTTVPKDTGAAKTASEVSSTAALAHAMTAAEVGQRGRQARPDAVGANFLGDDCPSDLAACRTGAGVPLVFGDHCDDGRYLDRLEAGRLGIGRGRRRWQFRAAAFAVRRAEDHGLVDPLGGQQLLEMGRVARLGTATALGLLLLDGLGCVKGVAGGWERGVAAVGAQPCFELGDTPLQLGDASEVGQASRANHFPHADVLSTRMQTGTLSLKYPVNGY